MSEILKKVSDYYTDKVKQFGLDSKGVDWNSKESQYLRFDKLLDGIQTDSGSILDYGCGTGELVNFLRLRNIPLSYEGFDVSKEMVRIARETHTDSNVSFLNELPNKPHNYVIGSGIFNVKLGFTDQDWHQYILDTLEKMNNLSTKGFSFNVLTLYSDLEKRRSDLYYADPLYFFDYCKRRYSRFITLLHDYPLYEFTIIVRKQI